MSKVTMKTDLDYTDMMPEVAPTFIILTAVDSKNSGLGPWLNVPAELTKDKRLKLASMAICLAVELEDLKAKKHPGWTGHASMLILQAYEGAVNVMNSLDTAKQWGSVEEWQEAYDKSGPVAAVPHEVYNSDMSRHKMTPEYVSPEIFRLVTDQYPTYNFLWSHTPKTLSTEMRMRLAKLAIKVNAQIREWNCMTSPPSEEDEQKLALEAVLKAAAIMNGED